MDHDVTHGHLCVKGRFGFEFVHRPAVTGYVEYCEALQRRAT